MTDPSTPLPRRRFGVFEVNPDSGELRKQGSRVRLAEQSFQVLLALIERPGEVITREQLRQRLWPGDTFVEFDANLNTAVSLLREALGDSAKSPRFIETLPRRGYRFLADVSVERGEAAASVVPDPKSPATPRQRAFSRSGMIAGACAASVALAGLSYRYAGTPSEGIDSIAVLPLVYAGPQSAGDQEHLADGLTSALITELARLGVPNVISETSVMRYKGVANKPLPVIARELGADVLVEGSVQREGNIVRVNAQLIDARSDRHMWAQTYQQEMHSILALQDKIASAIVREIRTALTPGSSTSRTTPQRVNPRAHEAYLRGRYALRSELEERRSRALAFFEESIRLDTSFAPAYAGLAEYYGFTDALPPEQAIPKAKSYAVKALELDDTLAGAHLTLALASTWGDWDWAVGEEQFKRSLQLDPSDATTRRWYMLFLDLMGRTDAAGVQARRIRELDPVSPHTYHAVGFHYFMTRQYGEALKQFRALQELSPNDPKAFEGLGSTYVQLGAHEKAIGTFERAIDVWGRDAAMVGALASAHASAGHVAEARSLLDELKDIGQQRHVPPTWFAMIHILLKEPNLALDWLERAFVARDTYLVHLKVSPIFDSLREEARFQDLLRRMNFPPAPSASN
jgi:TolB-like protein/DNA-binding winged helix-turn-helix (wHTH) protein/Tfp pilus assembly protein PilF